MSTIYCRVHICHVNNLLQGMFQLILFLGWVVRKRELPTLMELCLLDTVIAKVQVLTEDGPPHTPSSDTTVDLNK